MWLGIDHFLCLDIRLAHSSKDSPGGISEVFSQEGRHVIPQGISGIFVMKGEWPLSCLGLHHYPGFCNLSGCLIPCQAGSMQISGSLLQSLMGCSLNAKLEEWGQMGKNL
jgi:hypothetical protein